MKTAEEILKENTKRTLNIVEDSPLHVAVIKAMEEYRSQSELPSEDVTSFTEEEIKEAKIIRDSLIGRKGVDDFKKLYMAGEVVMSDQLQPLLASHVARIKELEEKVKLINGDLDSSLEIINSLRSSCQ